MRITHIACAAALTLLLVRPTEAQTVKLGVLTDLSGPYSDVAGKGIVEATRMAVEDLHGLLGNRKVEIVAADHQNLPDVGVSIARQWLDQGGVTAIVHVPNSAIALAVQGITRERKRIFLMTGGTSSDLTGKSCSPYSVHWTDDTYTLSAGTVRVMLDRGGDTWFFIAADYAFGRSLVDGATKKVLESGGKILGTARAPLGTSDFSSFLLAAQASGAKVIALAEAGDDTTNALKQAHEFGVGRSQSLIGMAMNMGEVEAIGLEAAQGLYVVASYYWDRTDATREWSKRFMSRTGNMPSKEHAATYSAVQHYLRAVATEDTIDADRVIARMKATPVDDFFGAGGRVRADGRLIDSVFVWRVKSPAASRYRFDDYEQVGELTAAEAFRPLAEGGCTFVTP